jgi:phosphonate transport system permease protein
MTQSDISQDRKPETWRLKPAFDVRVILLCFVALFGLSLSAQRLDLGQLFGDVGSFLLASAGLKESSSIGNGLSGVTNGMFPLVFDERTPIEYVDNLEAQLARPFARLDQVTVEETVLDPETLEIVTRQMAQSILVEPGGYLFFVLFKMLETVEIALWATLFAVLASLPLSILCARNYAPHLLVYAAGRTFVSFLRSVPELISALFLVLAFGFGAIPGIVALALHSIGFLAKFFAEDIEGADVRPQEAIAVTGAGRLRVLRLAVLPQVLPSFTGLTLYILDRNVRMATVIGLVGAGGIGQELKGRFDMFQYDRVGTLLLIIFLTVLLLDLLAARIRRVLI